MAIFSYNVLVESKDIEVIKNQFISFSNDKKIKKYRSCKDFYYLRYPRDYCLRSKKWKIYTNFTGRTLLWQVGISSCCYGN